jgi:hypothetical protein
VADAVHAIRLTAAWERSELAGWIRYFGSPSRLGRHHRVNLVCHGPSCEPELRLNGEPLGRPDRVEASRLVWDVTALLIPRNSLEIAAHADIGLPPETGRRPLPTACGEVLLEIREPGGMNNA